MHICSTLPIFLKGTFDRTTNHIILSIIDLTCQSNIEGFIKNVKKICEVFYYIFINRYILGLEAYWKRYNSKKTVKRRSQSSASNWYNTLIKAKMI